jgi:deoxyribodipyrimidine photo-lyase
MKQPLIIYWSRRDFRLRDNRALANAVQTSNKKDIPLLPVFFIEPYMTRGDDRALFGYPSRYFLVQALPSFIQQFESFGLFHAKPVVSFTKLAKKYDLEIYVNEDIHPDFYTQIRKLRDRGIAIKLFRDHMTISRDTVTGAGDCYSIFTPFKKAVWSSFINESEDKKVSTKDLHMMKLEDIPFKSIIPETHAIQKLFSSQETFSVDGVTWDIATLGLPQRDLSHWYFSEEQALVHFKKFLKKLTAYQNARDMLGDEGTSRMSLALTWGLVSSRTLVALMKHHFKNSFENPLSLQTSIQGPLCFISELIWREFYQYLLFHNHRLLSEPFQKKFEHIRWVSPAVARKRFQLWMQGKTGYPLVDAAMMQLACTGWMHNRARMVVASILTKNLGVDWRWGQEYFRAMLIDLDEASNNGGWQWGASVGADPKPIRIFNPYLQAKNYDPEQWYQNTWLDEDYLHHPPAPLVPHEDARADALKRYHL